MTTGDLDGDGRADIAVALPPAGVGSEPDTLTVLHGPFTRRGAYGRKSVRPATPGLLYGKLVSSGFHRGRPSSLLVHTPDDGEQSPAWLITGGRSGYQARRLNEGNALAFGDFDGDGRADALVADDGSRNNEPGYETEPPQVHRVMTVYPGRPGAGPQTRRDVEPPRAPIAADVDGDGDDDLAAGGPGGVRILPGGPSGLGTRAWPGILPDEARRVYPAAAGDYDGDGRTEIALLGRGMGYDLGDEWWVTDGVREEGYFEVADW
jgi:hypothetical protein